MCCFVCLFWFCFEERGEVGRAEGGRERRDGEEETENLKFGRWGGGGIVRGENMVKTCCMGGSNRREEVSM